MKKFQKQPYYYIFRMRKITARKLDIVPLFLYIFLHESLKFLASSQPTLLVLEIFRRNNGKGRTK